MMKTFPGASYRVAVFLGGGLRARRGRGLLARMSVGWTATELTVVTGVNGVHSGFFDLVAHAINVGLGPTGAVVVLAVALAIAAAVTRSFLTVVRALIQVTVPWALADVVKVIVQRPRPDSAALPFPTGVDPCDIQLPERAYRLRRRARDVGGTEHGWANAGHCEHSRRPFRRGDGVVTHVSGSALSA